MKLIKPHNGMRRTVDETGHVEPLVKWLEHLVEKSTEYVFGVNTKGIYETLESPKIPDFLYQKDNWEFSLTWSIPINASDLDHSLQSAHKSVVMVLLRTIGPTKTNKILENVRGHYKFKKLRNTTGFERHKKLEFTSKIYS